MRKIVVCSLLLVFAVLLAVIPQTTATFARPLTPKCSSVPVWKTYEAKGQTSAYVSLAIWKDCTGRFYASATSVRDENGFGFTGSVWLRLIPKNMSDIDSHDSLRTYCVPGATCETDHINPTRYYYVIGKFETDNGLFYS